MIEKISGIFIFLTLLILILLQSKYFDFAIPISILGLFVSAAGLILLRKGEFVFPKRITPFFMLFLLAIFISAIFSRVPEESFPSLIFYASTFLIFLIGFNLSVYQKKFALIWQYALLTFGTLIILYSLLSEFPQITSGKQFVGPFYWYNQMAGFLMYLIPLPLTLFIVGKKKILWGALSLLLIGSFVLTYSRASWVSLALALSPLIFLFKKQFSQNKKVLAIFAISFVILVPIIFSFGFLETRVKSIVSELSSETRTPSGNLRVTTYIAAFEIFKDNPMFGVGAGVFGEASRAYQKVPWLYAKYTHNHFLQILSEVGLFGFISFVLLFARLTFVIFKKRTIIFKDIYIFPLLISLTAASIHNSFDVDWNWPSLALLFWLSLGILLGRIFEKSEIWEPKFKLVLGLAFSVLFLTSLYLFGVERQMQVLLFHLSGEKVNLSQADSSLNFLKIAPFYSSYYLTSGNLRVLQGKSDEALISFAKAQTLNPFNSEPIYNQALVLENMKEFELAEEKYREAISLNPYSEVKYYIGAAEMSTANLDLAGAENTLEAGTQAFPHNDSYKGFTYLYEFTGFNKEVSKLHRLYADLLLFHGKTLEAKKVNDEALSFDPTSIDSQNLEKIIETRIESGQNISP